MKEGTIDAANTAMSDTGAMVNASVALLLILGGISASLADTPLSTQWEELTAADFVQAIHRAEGVCLLPFGILEKHGPSGVLGTDLINSRYVSIHAAEQQYAVVFPPYYFGQIFEAKHQPGTVAYSPRLQLDLLQETVAEMARNGCKKILIVNGHGGNDALLNYFSQIQLERPRDYVVFTVMDYALPDAGAKAAPPSKPGVDGHAGEDEISNLMASRPGLAHPERAAQESGIDQRRLDLPARTGIEWYASFPNHYEGDATKATAARGQLILDARIRAVAEAIRAVKADTSALKLQQEFFDRAAHPLDTPQ